MAGHVSKVPEACKALIPSILALPEPPRGAMMVTIMSDWTLFPEEDRLTALELLRRRLPAAPQAYLRQLLRSGKVRRGDLPLGAATVLRAGERVTLPASQRLQQMLLASAEQPLRILFENDRLLTVFKPAGLAIHRGVGHEEDNLTARVQTLLRQRQAPYMAAPAHRLDAETSGPVLFGKGRRAVAELGRLFMTRAVTKTYLALVPGEMAGSGRLTTPVPAKGKMREAATAYRTVATGSGYTLLQLDLQTGRTHQIRRQLADAGHPVAGDRRYRGPRPAGLNRLFLHCAELALTDPGDRSSLVIASPLPEELASVLAALGIAADGPSLQPPGERPAST